MININKNYNIKNKKIINKENIKYWKINQWIILCKTFIKI